MITTNHLSKSGIPVTALGLGCATLAGIFEPVPAQAAHAIIDEAFAAGIRYFDTAPFYGLGLSERLVGDSLRQRSGFTLSSKVGRLLKAGRMENPGNWAGALPFTPQFDYSYDGILRSFEDSLQRLGLARIDILYLHDIDTFTHGPEQSARLLKTALSGSYRALDTLRRNGQVGAIGLGVNEIAPCLAALDYGDWDVFLLAGRYTLLEQAPLQKLFPACARARTDIVCGGPFNSGVLAGGKTFDYGAVPAEVVKRVKAIAALCADHKVALPAAALHFCRAHPVIKSTIPGPRTPEELHQITAWWNAAIPRSFWADLKSAGLVDGAAPVPG